MAEYAGVDLGATKIRTAVGTADRTVVGEDRRPTPQAETGIEVTEAVLDSLRAACAAGNVPPERLQAVGVGSFGPLDLAAGAIVRPANLPDSVSEIPLQRPIESLVGEGRVKLQNDTVAGVIAERTYGAHNPDDMVYLTMSSGIGAGVCVDGRILNGWDGNAGEVGHLTLDPNGAMTCGCGSPGHWEAYCSGENIPRYARYLHEAEGHVTDMSLDVLTAADVFAAEDDPLAERVIDRLAHWNTLGVANLVDAYAPLVVVVGGAVAVNNPEQVLDPIRDRLEDHVVANVPEVRLTDLGEAVVVKGALASVTPEQSHETGQLQD
ncbi:MAG: ROK family protein [Haloplanus sp.]